MILEDAYIEGWNAFLKGLDIKDNPYLTSSDWDVERHWEWGWEGCRSYSLTRTN